MRVIARRILTPFTRNVPVFDSLVIRQGQRTDSLVAEKKGCCDNVTRYGRPRLDPRQGSVTEQSLGRGAVVKGQVWSDEGVETRKRRPAYRAYGGR